jgi:hypothetical protein
LVKNQKMQFEKKLILCSILAISIGVASIAPLAFFMSSAKVQPGNDIPWFIINSPYAYYITNVKENTSSQIGNFTIFGLASYSANYLVGFNLSVNPAVTHFVNTRIEYYNLHFYSDLGSITDVVVYFGANCTGTIDPSSSFSFRNNWFNTSASISGEFMLNFNGTLTPHVIGMGGISPSGSVINTTLPAAFLNARNAQTIIIDISRMGYVTFDDDNTIVTLADKSIIQHIELTKNEDRFTFGDIPGE